MQTLIGRIFLVVIISASLSQQGCGGLDLENEKVGLSEDHLEFIEIVSSTREKYEKAENELQKTQLRKKRMKSFKSLLPRKAINKNLYPGLNCKDVCVKVATTQNGLDPFTAETNCTQQVALLLITGRGCDDWRYKKVYTQGFSNWKGELVDMGTTGDQKAWLYIRPLGLDDVLITTYNNDLSDTGTGSLISTESPVYDEVSTLSKGDIVYLSAVFMTPGGDDDYFEESSLTENGAVTDPQFIVKFKCVKKVADGPCE
jgi:hypothetical protein